LERRATPRNWGIWLSVARKGLILVWLPMGVQLIALFFTGYWLVTEFREVQRHHHKRYLQENLEVMLVHSMNVGFSMARYYMSQEPRYLSEYEDHIGLIRSSISHLQTEAQGSEQLLVQKLKQDAENLFDVGTGFKRDMANNHGAAGGTQTRQSALRQQLFDRIRDLESDVRTFEQSLQLTGSDDPAALKTSGLRVLLLIAAMTGANILLAIMMGAWFSEGITGRLKILTENSYRLSRSQNLHPRLPGSDEIAHLDRVFHDMANALAEAARKERAVIQHAADVICSIDANGRFSAVSPASLQVLGYEPEELIGRRFIDLVIEEDRASTEKAFMRITEAEPDPQPIQSRVQKKNGETVHILLSAYWAPSEQSMFCVAHDITERQKAEDQLKASEARTRSIFESAPVALLVVDELGTIKLTNPKAEHIFGYTTEEMVGRHVSVLLPDSADFDEKDFRNDMLKNMAGGVRELKAKSRTERIFPIELTIENYISAEGERFLAAILDVTERHEVERLRRDFVSTVSHELRTPLTSIRGSLTLLAVGALGHLSDQGDKAVKIAERNCLRLINLINDLLDIEKLEAGKLEMICQDVPLQQVVDRSIDAVRAFADQYGIRFRVEPIEATVFADPDRLVQVLVNLLSNAIKYSPRDEAVTLIASIRGDMLRVSVNDRGRGIPEDFKNRIFERFQQVEPEDWKRKGGGTGLGLAICKAIIEQHNGIIGVDNCDAGGSTFWFEIPLAGTARALAVVQSELYSADGDTSDVNVAAREVNNVAEERT
jgi:PAS domain S-box-containing protein